MRFAVVTSAFLALAFAAHVSAAPAQNMSIAPADSAVTFVAKKKKQSCFNRCIAGGTRCPAGNASCCQRACKN